MTTPEIPELRFFRSLSERATSDPEWAQIFSNMAEGIMPSGFYYNNGKIYHEVPNIKRTFIKIPSDVSMGYKKCREFFRKNGVSTTKDQEGARNRKYKGWTTVRRDEKKLYYLHRYALNLQAQYSLNDEEYKELWHCLSLLVLLGEAKADCVRFNNGAVHEITKIRFDESTRTFRLLAGQPTAPKRTRKT